MAKFYDYVTCGRHFSLIPFSHWLFLQRDKTASKKTPLQANFSFVWFQQDWVDRKRQPICAASVSLNRLGAFTLCCKSDSWEWEHKHLQDTSDSAWSVAVFLPLSPCNLGSVESPVSSNPERDMMLLMLARWNLLFFSVSLPLGQVWKTSLCFTAWTGFVQPGFRSHYIYRTAVLLNRLPVSVCCSTSFAFLLMQTELRTSIHPDEYFVN